MNSHLVRISRGSSWRFQNAMKTYRKRGCLWLTSCCSLNGLLTDTKMNKFPLWNYAGEMVYCVLTSVWETRKPGRGRTQQRKSPNYVRITLLSNQLTIWVTIKDKAETIAKNVYGATNVHYSDEAYTLEGIFEKLGWNHLNVYCQNTILILGYEIKKDDQPISISRAQVQWFQNSVLDFIVALTGTV